MNKRLIEQKVLTGERALFKASNLNIKETIFQDGESPLKESDNIKISDSIFKWKYPVWYSRNIDIDNTTWFDGARAGFWYSNNVNISNSLVQAPKNFRRCNGLSLKDVTFSDAQETLWGCKNITLENVSAGGDYFAMNCENIEVDNLSIVGGYSFDGVKNAVIRNSKIITKDPFWNSENVTVYDSFISSEYLGWNAKNLTLINCTIESNQGMCYIENLVMKNCRLMNTTLAFEYSTVDVEIIGHIDSIKNPIGGRIVADSIGEIILDDDSIDHSKTEIVIKESKSNEVQFQQNCKQA